MIPKVRERGPRIDKSAPGLLFGIPGGKKRTGDDRPRRGTLPARSKDFDRRHGQDFGPQAEACRTMACSVCGKLPHQNPDGYTDPHHEPPVSLGGKDKDTVPLCRDCHDLRGTMTDKAFWALAPVDLETVREGVQAWLKSDAYKARRGCP